MYQIRKAKEEDLPRILSIYAYARSFMARTGNPNQWGTEHPKVDVIVQDMQRGELNVVEADGIIHGVFAFIPGPDPTYAYMEGGAWRSDAPYGAIHKVASDGSGGIFGAVLAYCSGQIGHLRIDTHEDNRIMQHVIEKHGFSRQGIIYVADGSPRIAYDRI